MGVKITVELIYDDIALEDAEEADEFVDEIMGDEWVLQRLWGVTRIKVTTVHNDKEGLDDGE